MRKNIITILLISISFLVAGNKSSIHEITSTYINSGNESKNWINLSGGELSGQALEYYSPFSEVTKAVISRASDGLSTIQIKSQIKISSGSLTLAMLVGIGTNLGEFPFELSINNENYFNFSTYNKKFWIKENSNGSKLEFREVLTDNYGDKFGIMLLSIPANLIHENNITISITGEKKNSNAWIMVFKDVDFIQRLQKISSNSYQYKIEKNSKTDLFEIHSTILNQKVKYTFDNASNKIKADSEFPIKIYTNEMQIDELTNDTFLKEQYSIFKDKNIYRTITKNDDKTLIISSKSFFINIPDDQYPWSSLPQDFPALMKYDNNIWMAVVEREENLKQIAVYKNENEMISKISSKDWTGIGNPDISKIGDEVFVTFSYEKQDQWKIGYAKILENKVTNISTIKTKSVNNSNSKIISSKFGNYIIFQGVTDKYFQIFVYNLTTKKIIQISEGKHNNYNPDVTVLDNGNLYIVWDSFRENNFNIFSNIFSGKRWQKEKQITDSQRIDRHPSVATFNNEIWLAWQSQSYGNKKSDFHEKNIRLNHIDEQRIVVAKWENDELHTLPGIFTKISTYDKYLLRPKIVFTLDGSLILSHRQSAGNTEGWLPIFYQYVNNSWSQIKKLSDMTGNWNSVPIIVKDDIAFAAVQIDNYPDKNRSYSDSYKWRSKVEIKKINLKINSEKIITEKLVMPVTKFNLKEKRNLVAADFPRQTIRSGNQKLNLYIGNFHEHSTLSKCARAFNPPINDLYTNLRDIEELDFCGITDHEAVSQSHWFYNSELNRQNHIDDKFITFLAEEWTSTMHRNNNDYGLGYGHRNLIFLNQYQPINYKPDNGKMSPDELWKLLENEEFITIPHQLADWEHMKIANGVWGNPPIDWHYHDAKYQPVAEIYQDRGSYEYLGCPKQAHDSAPFKQYYLQDAWARKKIIGTIASSDHGGGHGKIGVWAENLSREAIFGAIQKRHTFGSSAPKMSIFFSSGNNIMGDVCELPKEFNFQIKAKTIENIKEIVLFRNNIIVKKIEINTNKFNINWTDAEPLEKDFIWYYVRLQTVDNEFAWTSPIWFVK